MEVTLTSILGTTNKTPISLIREVCVKKKLPPPTWRTNVLQLTPPKFKSVCSVTAVSLSQTAEGFGSSKKEAEHKAAEELLKLLVNITELYEISGAANLASKEQPNSVISSGSNGDEVYNEPVSAVSDMEDDDIRGEPIGELNTLCLRHKLPMAVFKDESVKRGPGNTLTFTVSCSIEGWSSHAARRIKKQDAKKVGAFRVLRELKEKGFSLEKPKKAEPTIHAALAAVTQRNAVKPDAEVSSSIEMDVMELDGNMNSNSTFSDSDEEAMQIVDTLTLQENHPSTSGVMIVGPETEEPQPGPSREITSGNGDNEDSLEDMELVESVKRKLAKEDEFQDRPEKVGKYERLLGTKLVCPEMSKNCLKFIKDYWHVFQHLPSSAELDEALVSQDYFHNVCKVHGGPIPLLKRAEKDLDLKLSFTRRSRISNDEHLIFLKIRIPTRYHNWYRRKGVFVVSACGSTIEIAKEKAALEALKTIRCMSFTNIDNNNTPFYMK